MTHQLEVQLADSPSAFPRLVATLHARGLRIQRANLTDLHCTLTVGGVIPANRIVAVLGRLVDVSSARLAEAAPMTTRCVVTRQASAQGHRVTPHPWSSSTQEGVALAGRQSPRDPVTA